MKKSTRWISLFLALCLTLPALTSCKKAETDAAAAPGTTAAAETVPAGEDAEPADTRTPHAVPQADFDGEEFRSYHGLGYARFYFADDYTGDAMNDAVWDRTMMVEEHLNVKLTRDREDDYNIQTATIKQLVQAGDDAYQQVLLHCIMGVAELSSGGYLYNLDKLPCVDFSQPWWNQTQMDVLRLGNNTYYGVSDFMIPTPYVIFFNKDMVAEHGMESPYQLVYDGKWTMDAMTGMIETAVRDMDGDGEFTGSDVWGIYTDEFSKYVSFMSSAGQFISSRDENNRIVLAMNTERTQTIVEKLYQMTSMTGGAYTEQYMGAETKPVFGEGKTLFFLDALSNAVKLREVEVDIGILPYPKFDEAQEAYISQDWGGLMGVPSVMQNDVMVGSVLELLAYFSEETTLPAFYDITLDGKVARDEDSVAMMDIVFDSIAYEIGGNYFGFSEGFAFLFYTLGLLVIQDKSTNFASYYKTHEKQALQVIDKFYTDLDYTESQ